MEARMRALLIVVLVVIGLGFVFWDNLFYSAEEADTPVTEEPPVTVMEIEEKEPPAEPDPEPQGVDYASLAAANDLTQAIEQLKGRPSVHKDLAALHLHLLNQDRFEAAGTVLENLVQIAPASPVTARAVMDMMEKSPASAKEKRQYVSRVSKAFLSMNSQDTVRLVAAVQKINSGLPGSIKGLVKMEKYKVVPNDCLWNICKKYRQENGFSIESGLIHRLNGMRSDIIYPGQALMIPKEKPQIRVYTNNWLMTVSLGDTLLDAYRVGLGKEGKTPEGLFVIKSKLEDPDWYSDRHGRIIPSGDPENILGTRWLGFQNREDARGFGIHGTTQPDSIGKNMSSGCIRMYNEDVEDLFKIIARGTPVEVL
jgi:hypothetical protein